jgi:hypothetical protein
MKRISSPFILIFALLSTFQVFSQTKPQAKTEQEIKVLLCHKWQLTYMEAEGKKTPIPPEMGKSYILLKSDGTLVETSEGKDNPGRWSYDHKNMTIKTDDKDGAQSHKIIKITETEFIIEDKSDGTTVDMIMKRIN